MDDPRMEIWKNAKKGAAEKGFPNAPIGVVDFAMRDRPQTVPFAVMITDDSMARVKAGVGFEMESALIPGRRQVPLSHQPCMDFINMHIRSDKKNQLQLHTHLSKADIDKLRGSDSAE